MEEDAKRAPTPAEAGPKPFLTRLVPRTMKCTGYSFLQRASLRYLVKPDGMNAVTTPDVEFADLAALGRYVDEYLEKTQGAGR